MSATRTYVGTVSLAARVHTAHPLRPLTRENLVVATAPPQAPPGAVPKTTPPHEMSMYLPRY